MSVAKSELYETMLLKPTKPIKGIRPGEICMVLKDDNGKLFIQTDIGKMYLEDHITFFGYLDGFEKKD